MANHTISATEASRSLSDILNKVFYQGQSFEIKRGKEIIAKIVPAVSRKHILKLADLNELLRRLPSLEVEDKKAFEADLKSIRSHMRHEEDPWD